MADRGQRMRGRMNILRNNWEWGKGEYGIYENLVDFRNIIFGIKLLRKKNMLPPIDANESKFFVVKFACGLLREAEGKMGTKGGNRRECFQNFVCQKNF